MKKGLAASTFLMLALTGCASGGLAGGASALLEPSSYAPAPEAGKPVAGIVGGGLIGGDLGQGMGRHAKREALEAEYKALETAMAGQPIAWGNSGSGTGGHVVAAQPYRVGSQNCRQYAQTIDGGPARRSARGTACRNADGSWTLLN